MISFTPRRYHVSCLSSPLMPARQLAHVSLQPPLDGVEIDLLDAIRCRLQGWSRPDDQDLGAVRIVWFPPSPDNRLPAVVERIVGHHQQQAEQLTLVIDQPRRRNRDTLSQQMNLAIKLRASAGPGTRIAIGVRPFQIENTRAHLANLSALRLQTSEWDIDVALDLARELDWLWEAEAAVYRIFGSLAVVRLSYPKNTFDGRFRASLTQRVLSTCAELGYARDFSLMVPLPWWHWRNPRTLEAACREAATGIDRQLSRDVSVPDMRSPADHFLDRN